MSSNLNKSFCVLPWIHSFVNSNGNYQVCCTSEEYHPGIPDSEGVLYNISKGPSLYEVMNADLFKAVRQEMLNGKWNDICGRCLVTEKNGGISRRMLENSHYKDLIPSLIENTHHDGSLVQVNFKSIDYRLGNLCNLECRMCGPYSSSRWIKDWNAVKPANEQISEETKKVYESYDWINKPNLIAEFESKLKSVEHLHFAGGEPLIAPQMSEMLRHCIDLGVAQNIVLSYNTNITTLPKKVLELWKHFKGVRLLCSVDGYGVVNDYIRYPAKWDAIDKNLKYLDENFEEYRIEEILLSCTVQIYNVLFLDELYEYLGKFKKIIPALNLINLHVPFYFKTTLLPEDAKKEATLRLKVVAERLGNKLGPGHSYLVDNILQSIAFMNSEDLSEALPIFKSVNKKIDMIKNIHFSDKLPELSRFIE